MARPWLLLAAVAACSAPPAVGESNAPSPRASAPVERPPSSVSASPSPSPSAGAAAKRGPLAAYRLSLTPSTPSASNREDVQLAWKIEGGPADASGIVPRVRVRVEWVEAAPPKAGAKPEPKSAPQVFPKDSGDDLCSAPPLERAVTFAMAPKQSARIEAEVVGCDGRAPANETRATATASIDWVPPYVSEVEVPAVLTAGSTTRGTIRFRGIEGPGAPAAVKVTSNHPGIKITRQPEVAAASTFEIAVKPNVVGEARLTAEHVDTNGSGRIVGVLRKTAIVRIEAR